jgi:hypothetical protein
MLTPHQPSIAGQALSSDSRQSLSNDILPIAAEYADDTKTWASLSRCSKDLNRRTEAGLYSKFTQTRAHGSDLRSFIRSIVAKPSCARHLKHLIAIALPEPVPKDPVTAVDIASWTEEEQLGIRQACWDCNVFDSKGVCQKLERYIYGRSNWDACMALVLSLCSGNLESLTMFGYDINNEFPTHIETVLKHMTKLQRRGVEPNSLWKLREVSIECCDDYGRMSIEYVLPFLALPSVVKFSANRIEEDNFRPGYPISFYTQHLVFTHSAIAELAMTDFLKCFPVLRRFEYEHSGKCFETHDYYGYDTELDPKEY